MKIYIFFFNIKCLYFMKSFVRNRGMMYDVFKMYFLLLININKTSLQFHESNFSSGIMAILCRLIFSISGLEISYFIYLILY